MAKKDNKALLMEELKKHMRLVEYTFYVGEDKDVVGNREDDKHLLLGEEPEDDENDTPDADTEVSDEPMEEPADTELSDDEPMEEPTDEPMEEPATGDVAPAEEPMAANPAPAEDEIEIDITQLVQSTEEAKMGADMANEKMSQLIQHFNDLNKKINQLEDLNDKIKELEDEIVKRNPTPVEKLEMRSLDSFPYNLKLTDYWEDKEEEGDIEATGDAVEDVNGQEEYVLTDKDIDADYNQRQILQTFDIDNDDDDLDKFEYLK